MEFAWEQIGVFLRAIAVGAGIMACYDVFRMLRTAFRTAAAVVFLEDIVFFAAAGMATWFYLLESCRGELRGFVMVGEMLGGMLYFLTLGSLVMKIARPVIHFIQRVLETLLFRPARWIWRIAVQLFTWLVKGLKGTAGWLFRLLRLDKLWKLLKKREKKQKNSKTHLQEGHKLLYNLYVASFFRLSSGIKSRLGISTQEVKQNEQTSELPQP